MLGRRHDASAGRAARPGMRDRPRLQMDVHQAVLLHLLARSSRWPASTAANRSAAGRCCRKGIPGSAWLRCDRGLRSEFARQLQQVAGSIAIGRRSRSLFAHSSISTSQRTAHRHSLEAHAHPRLELPSQLQLELPLAMISAPEASRRKLRLPLRRARPRPSRFVFFRRACCATRRPLALRTKMTAASGDNDPSDFRAAAKTLLPFASVGLMVLLIISRLALPRQQNRKSKSRAWRSLCAEFSAALCADFSISCDCKLRA